MRTYIIGNYAGYYEAIHTERAIHSIFLHIKYIWKGYRTIRWPLRLFIWIAKTFGKKIPMWVFPNISIERYIKGSDQVTYWQPYMNFH